MTPGRGVVLSGWAGSCRLGRLPGRRTSTRYRDDDDSDVFVLSGADELVPMLDAAGARAIDPNSVPGFTLERFRPRIEGAFERIERWTDQANGDIHWRVLSADNVLSVYGRDAPSRVADPDQASRVFAWLLSEARDDRGNVVVYEYKREDVHGVDVTLPHEIARGDAQGAARRTQQYLKRIRYGNRLPALDAQGRRPLRGLNGHPERGRLDARSRARLWRT